MSIFGGDPPGLLEMLEPLVLMLSKIKNGSKSWTLWPLRAIAVTSGISICIFSDAALVSCLLERVWLAKLNTTVVRSHVSAEHTGIVKGASISPGATMDIGSVEELALFL